MTTISCPKCSGLGFIQMYGHVANGVCFSCNGKGTITAKLDRKPRAPVTAERKAELAAIKADKLLVGTIDDAINRAVYSIAKNPAFKAEIGVLITSFIRTVSKPNVTLSDARIADDLLSRAIYRIGN